MLYLFSETSCTYADFLRDEYPALYSNKDWYTFLFDDHKTDHYIRCKLPENPVALVGSEPKGFTLKVYNGAFCTIYSLDGDTVHVRKYIN